MKYLIFFTFILSTSKVLSYGELDCPEGNRSIIQEHGVSNEPTFYCQDKRSGNNIEGYVGYFKNHSTFIKKENNKYTAATLGKNRQVVRENIYRSNGLLVEEKDHVNNTRNLVYYDSAGEVKKISVIGFGSRAESKECMFDGRAVKKSKNIKSPECLKALKSVANKNALYSTLMQSQEDGKCESWTVSPDGMSVTSPNGDIYTKKKSVFNGIRSILEKVESWRPFSQPSAPNTRSQ